MRVLQVHNYYRSSSPSGENKVVDDEFSLLTAAGHNVTQFVRSNDEAHQRSRKAAIEGLLFAAWNPHSVRRIRRLFSEFRPDVMHVHNTFPLLSPAVLRVAKQEQVPLVWTVHNFRPWCVATTLLRSGEQCQLCLEAQSSLPGIRHGCRSPNSALTPASSASVALHQYLNTWCQSPDVVVALSSFQSQLLEKAGLPSESIAVKPNFAANATPAAWSNRLERIVYVGRLVEEKGIDLLLDALADWQQAQRPTLDIVGVGPLDEALRHRCLELGIADQVVFHGHLNHADTQAIIARAKLLVMPSRWHETFGLTVIEAFALGVPVVVSNKGALPELIGDGGAGSVFDIEVAGALSSALQSLWPQPELLERMAGQARQTFISQYSKEANLPMLEAIYHRAIRRSKNSDAVVGAL